MATLRDPDHKGMVGTRYPSALHTLKGFGLGPLTAELWAFFQILGDFQFFYFEATNSLGKYIFHQNLVKIRYNVQTDARKKFLEKCLEKIVAQFFFSIDVSKPEKNQNCPVPPNFFQKFAYF